MHVTQATMGANSLSSKDSIRSARRFVDSMPCVRHDSYGTVAIH
jgi:hypothetical protein